MNWKVLLAAGAFTLLPGMTANADIVIERQNNVLRIPNTALRFRPSDPDIAARGQALLRGSTCLSIVVIKRAITVP
jgi:hypothetical protein